MLLRLLHRCGLTNLSDDEIECAYRSETGASSLPLKGIVFVFAQICIVAVIAILNRPQPEAPEAPMLLSIGTNTLKNVPQGAFLMVPEKIVLQAKLDDSVRGKPIVLVRPLFAGQPWYVQEIRTGKGSNTFESLVHFGDRRTGQGTQFLLAIAIVTNTNLLESLKPGSQISDLSTNRFDFRELPDLPGPSTPLLVARR